MEGSCYGNEHFGVDYYPEHWPQERWETDAKLMKGDGRAGCAHGGILMV